MIELKLTTTASGEVAMWQQGGGSSRYGESLLIIDRMGNPKKAIRIEKIPDHNHHCLIPVETGDVIILVKNKRGQSYDKIYQLSDRTLNLYNERINGKWRLSVISDKLILPALEVAKSNSHKPPGKAVFYIQR